MSDFKTGDRVKIKPDTLATGLIPPQEGRTAYWGYSGSRFPLPSDYYWPRITGLFVGVVVDYPLKYSMHSVAVERAGYIYIVDQSQVEKLDNL
jgi:hypothetical protein